ncbi:hypothetical protein ACIBBE_24660 [Streptomyces sp. NPDC051644]|uniref:hypothetical protein n=1 Tax=Streptomyces sp. NPDC051644 TaxID=3365666 RepID=UPI0037BC9731
MPTVTAIAIPPLPDASIPATELDDEALTEATVALDAWYRAHLLDSGVGPHIKRGEPSRTALITVAARMRELKRVRKERDHSIARDAFHQREAQRKADNEARAQIGRPSRAAGGALVYPVSADMLGELGTVCRSFYGRMWRFTRADTGSSGQEYDTLRAAAGALVWLGDLAVESAERQRRQDAARAAVPDGWELADWDELTKFDLIRIPAYGRAEDGALYPRCWRDPLEVRGVNRLESGGLVISLVQADGGADPLFVSSQEMKDVGVLWPTGRIRPEPQPWREKLRVRMADIADDIETIRRPFGSTALLQGLADLLARLERAHSEDLFADLRRVEAATGYIRVQVGDTNQPYEVREIASWGVAAHLKATYALEAFAADPDFAWAVAAGR